MLRLQHKRVASWAFGANRHSISRQFATTTSKPPTAVVLMNLGGPKDLNEVQPFLQNLFSDGDLIPIPFQQTAAKFLAKRRTPKIQEQYAAIGGGSPILSWTEKQGKMLEERLDKLSPQTAPHKSYIAFRYSSPLTPETLAEMKKDGVERAVAFSLYPQYSCSTTGSSLNELWKNLKVLDPENKIRWSVVDRWPTHSGLVEVFARHIEKALLEYPENERKDAVLLFSAHSLPMSVVNRGDPYPQEVAATVQRVMERLGFSNPYRLIWQSQVGPRAWLGPQTDQVLEGYAKLGKKNLLMIPIAFVSDHIETLFEVDVEYGHLAKEKGLTGFKRVESLNDDPVFIDAMADLVSKQLSSKRPVSTQLGLRCPLCTNEKCGQQKEFFAGQVLE
ncbi:ferrochelatase [Spizellomyces punctatus DAOM BR117]|uniref:Ferrochelatase n=1 Tax=Spizellomyces punctatus (strain DAOM BR117) TaxID=645134 RepID=A0A0L0HN25_SPIPD|nr:ferrochelatase [Spizellomyces punctatus DAOM BR117]KND02821.1 ferrochelatase [Spizellomyces punctatus DAOM BR117]|eukprot:XP_016610860.1 ferrochelatase [Spizellomyces punctatus DAOM BR117]